MTFLAAQHRVYSLRNTDVRKLYRDGKNDNGVLLVEPNLNHFNTVVVHQDGVGEQEENHQPRYQQAEQHRQQDIQLPGRGGEGVTSFALTQHQQLRETSYLKPNPASKRHIFVLPWKRHRSAAPTFSISEIAQNRHPSNSLFFGNE